MAQPPNPFEQQRSIPGVRNIVAVSSGKGGVGKSTVATNLAVALAKQGSRVGLLDADIYGPSIPRMMGSLNQKPDIGDDRRIQPLERFGLKLMSIGFLIEEELAVVWRGPMLFKAMEQFIREVAWGELDYLIIDLPPGTGDVQLSIAQKVPLAGTIAVSTPQNVALNDVKKSLDMWARTGVPILGVIENMAYFNVPAVASSEVGARGSVTDATITGRVQLFPKGQLDSYLKEKGILKLGEIPFHQQIGIGGEAGIPLVESHPQSAEAKEFFLIASRLRELVP